MDKGIKEDDEAAEMDRQANIRIRKAQIEKDNRKCKTAEELEAAALESKENGGLKYWYENAMCGDDETGRKMLMEQLQVDKQNDPNIGKACSVGRGISMTCPWSKLKYARASTESDTILMRGCLYKESGGTTARGMAAKLLIKKEDFRMFELVLTGSYQLVLNYYNPAHPRQSG